MQIDINEFNKLLDECFRKYSVDFTLTDCQRNQFFILTDFLLTENEKYNLTAVRTVEGVIEIHIFDSITASIRLPHGATVIDVGSGAGFPALPLAVYRPDLSVTALDSTTKKLNFIKACAEMMKISNISTLFGRAEELSAPDMPLRDSFDAAIGRSVASLPILAELCIPFVKPGGCFIAMKSESALHEVKAAANALFLLNCTQKPDIVKPYSIDPATDKLLIVAQKRAVTPSKYPRSFAQIKKKPL